MVILSLYLEPHRLRQAAASILTNSLSSHSSLFSNSICSQYSCTLQAPSNIYLRLLLNPSACLHCIRHLGNQGPVGAAGGEKHSCKRIASRSPIGCLIQILWICICSRGLSPQLSFAVNDAIFTSLSAVHALLYPLRTSIPVHAKRVCFLEVTGI